MEGYLFDFIVALVISAIATPLCRKAALMFGVLDHPGYRKIHTKAMPLLGGLAVYLGFVITTLLDFRDSGTSVLLIGGTVILFLGILDDKYAMGARMKFILPGLSAGILIVLGIHTVFLPEYAHNILNLGFSFLWIMGLVNAFNFIDNMDGLSIGTAFISSMVFGVLGLLTHQSTVAVLSFSLGGACLGFLFYNFKPAKIFAGDAGSMFVGFMLASIAIYASWETPNVITSLFVPVLALGYPIFDTCFVTFLRIINRKPFWIGDKNHSSHRLVKLGSTQRGAVLLAYGISIALGVTSIIILRAKVMTAFLSVVSAAVFLTFIGMVLARVPFEWKKERKRG